MSALDDTNIVAILAKHFSGVSMPVIVTVHNHLSAEVRNATQLKRRLVPYLIRWIYPRADAVVGVSQGVAKDLLKFGSPPQKTHAIYNPIITTEVLNGLQESLEHEWFLPDQPPVILAVGRLDKQKILLL
jgi:glycosyltransferase involved in cell wall biosynthesis